MTDTNTFTKPRKTLRQSLKDLLRLRIGRSTPKNSAAMGSGILRRGEASYAYQLPQHSAVSLFPDFGASTFDVSQYTIRNRAQEHLQVPASAHQPPHSKRSLLPATSLSQFNLRQTFAQHGEIVPQRVVYETVSDGYLSGLSRQPSLASVASSALHKSASSLRIRESTTDLRSSANSPSDSVRDGRPGAKPERQSNSHVSPHDSRPTQRRIQATSSSTAQSSSSSISFRRRNVSPITLVEDHFKSFCVLDTAMSGCPVTATSSELRYIFEIGESFFLNNQECEGTSMDIVTGTDAAGNPVTHLVLFSPLVTPSSGRSRFMLASLVDVSRMIYETATLPELDTISEEGSVASLAEAVATPPMQTSPGWKSLSHELSVEDLLGGCYMSDDDPPQKNRDSVTDIWLDLAIREGRSRDSGRNNSRARQSMYAPSTRSSISSKSAASSVDDVLDTFVTNLQAIYSDFFLLGKNALDDNCYEICNVSPTVWKAKEYVDGHLSRTPRETIERLGLSLSQETPFTISVNWGARGEPRQLYCAPMYGQRSLAWICFLVEANLPMLW